MEVPLELDSQNGNREYSEGQNCVEIVDGGMGKRRKLKYGVEVRGPVSGRAFVLGAKTADSYARSRRCAVANGSE